MDKEKILAEIKRVEAALEKTTSRKLKHDYGKHLKRLRQNIKYYDMHMNRR